MRKLVMLAAVTASRIGGRNGGRPSGRRVRSGRNADLRHIGGRRLHHRLAEDVELLVRADRFRVRPSSMRACSASLGSISGPPPAASWCGPSMRRPRGPRAALAGNYGGASAEATVGAGVGANVLVGGSNRTIQLQPLSVQGQTGLNVAAGVTGIELRWVR